VRLSPVKRRAIAVVEQLEKVYPGDREAALEAVRFDGPPIRSRAVAL
jgi:hypothetical protein